MNTTAQSISADSLSSLQKSFLIIRNLERKLQEEKSRDFLGEEIAVVGLACHLPCGIRSASDFWDALLNGEDLIADNGLTARWQDMGHQEVPLSQAMPHAGLLDDVTLFDNEYFHISPAEARYIDPQQRQLLMVVANALADAGIAPASLKGTDTGVFTGISAFDYSLHIMQQGDHLMVDPYLGSGNALSGASGRISYCYGFHGPCLSIDTACSSSLVALHQGAESLKRRECGLAIVSGANLVLSPHLQASLTEAGMLSPDGRCKAFDDSANGYVRSEGCLSVVLKRLSDAVRDGNRIYACIKGSAVAQDGASGGLTVPDPGSQAKVIRNALQVAGMQASDISFIEGHGTGTSLGDPVEAEGLKQVFGGDHTPDKKLLLGSVKSNVGHLEAAAGLAGFMKSCLSIYHRQLPPHLHFRKPNHHIDWDNMPFQINTDIHHFNDNNVRLAGGVSSFGFTGTIAHCIVAACDVTPAATIRQLPAPRFHLKPHWLGKLPGASAAGCYNIQWKMLQSAMLEEKEEAQYVYIETGNGTNANRDSFLRGMTCISVQAGSLLALDSIVPDQPSCVVYDISALAEKDAEAMKDVYQHLLSFLKSLQQFRHTPAAILFITRNAFHTRDNDDVAALQYSLTAFIKSASLELRGPVMLVLDIDKQLPGLTFIHNYVQQSCYRELAFRDGQIWYPAIAATGLSKAAALSFDPAGTYLITGGKGSLGAHLAEWMVYKGAGTVIIAGRSAGADTGNGRIIYRQLDVTDEIAVSGLADWLRKERKILKGIVHAAGTNSRCLLSNLTTDDIMYVAGPKIKGLQNITTCLPVEQLDFLVTYSSIAAVWGSGMLSHYAAVNAYMDGFVLRLRKQGIPAKTINWGPWEGSNMMLETENSGDLLKESGVPPFHAGAVRRMYAGLLVADTPQLIYVRLDNARFIPMMELQGPVAFWENLRPGVHKTVVSPPGKIDLSLIADDVEREELIRKELLRLVKQVLAIEEDEPVDISRSFSNMGMDSILLVKYVQRINAQLGLMVTTNMLFNYPTISGLSVYVNSSFKKAPAPRVRTEKVSSLYDMSDEEVLKMVSEEMQKY